VTYLQAFVIALIQGVTELFPVSSLGHSVLIPAWLGGSWQTLVTQSSQQNSESSVVIGDHTHPPALTRSISSKMHGCQETS
jgi:undecaprenyl pyrophosphate phosphatase UppP